MFCAGCSGGSGATAAASKTYLSKTPQQLSAVLDLKASAVAQNLTNGTSFSSEGLTFVPFNNISYSQSAFALTGNEYMQTSATVAGSSFSSFTLAIVSKYQELSACTAALFSTNNVNVYWDGLNTVSEALHVTVGNQAWVYIAPMPRTSTSLIVTYQGQNISVLLDGKPISMSASGSYSGPFPDDFAYFCYVGSIGFTGQIYETTLLPALSTSDSNLLTCYFANAYPSLSETATCY
jgi:hypothetical protein